MAKIQLGEREFPIRMSLHAVELIQKRYGSASKLETVILGDPAEQISETVWVLTALINEGLKYMAFEAGAPVVQVTEDQIGAAVDIKMLNNGSLQQAIIDAVNESSGGEKNLTAEDMMQNYETIRSGILKMKTT